jgi:hypothetical protein
LVTFVEVSVLSGWGFYLLTRGPRRAFLSHDEYVELAIADPAERDQFVNELSEVKLKVLNA